MSLQTGKEFLPNNRDGYQYGMFHQEVVSKYYISDKTITDIIDKVDWQLDSAEKSFIMQWRCFEKIHREYCLNFISLERYNHMIDNEYKKFAAENGHEFGECCDELINHIIRYLK